MKKLLSSACVLIGFVIGSLWGGDQVPGKVDINTASLAELDTLPALGRRLRRGSSISGPGTGLFDAVKTS